MPGRPILVVDDDASLRQIVAEALEHEGYDVLTAANGAEALGVVAKVEPSLILVDRLMPVLDGAGFVRALRERGLQTPILVIAATRAQQWAEEIGAAAYLSKPFDLARLLATVARFAGDPQQRGGTARLN